VTGVLLGAVAAVLVGATGLVVGTALRLRTLPELLLAAYLVAFAEMVGLTLLLSPFEAVTRAPIFVGLALLLAAAVAGWLALGAPTPPSAQWGRLRALRDAPVLLVLGAATSLAFAYVLALLVGTPPTSWDSMTYHLARAAFWSQNDGVGIIENAYDGRLNAHPPNSEIALTFVLEVGQNERLAGFLQLAAAFAFAVGVFALARRLGRPRGEAAFGAVLFLTLPIVILQASTTLNDLVAGSFLLAASVFVLGNSRRELGLAALATALAIGTKIPAAYGLPILVALAFVASPAAYRAQRLSAVAVGIALGSYWYLANLIRTGSPMGELNEVDEELGAVFAPTENFFAAYARLLDAFDFSGAIDADVFLYALVAVAVGVVVYFGALRKREPALVPAASTAALILAPFTLIPISYALWRVFAKLHNLLEEPDRRLPVGAWQLQTTAGESASWFGPLGLVLVVGVGAAVVVLVRRRSLPSIALVLVAAPLVVFVLVSLSVAYDPWQGRFLVFPVALSASLWGVVLARPRVAVASVAIAVTTATLALVHYEEKPSGLALLKRDVPWSVWNLDRAAAQSVLKHEMTDTLRFVETEVPPDASIALALVPDDFAYPAFGSGLSREVVLVPKDSGSRSVHADWLLASSARIAQIDLACWRPVHGKPKLWQVFRGAGCDF
jgi:hypothetical protein